MYQDNNNTDGDRRKNEHDCAISCFFDSLKGPNTFHNIYVNKYIILVIEMISSGNIYIYCIYLFIDELICIWKLSIWEHGNCRF